MHDLAEIDIWFDRENVFKDPFYEKKNQIKQYFFFRYQVQIFEFEVKSTLDTQKINKCIFLLFEFEREIYQQNIGWFKWQFSQKLKSWYYQLFKLWGAKKHSIYRPVQEGLVWNHDWHPVQNRK